MVDLLLANSLRLCASSTDTQFGYLYPDSPIRDSNKNENYHFIGWGTLCFTQGDIPETHA